jgi:hypothetical protein
VVEGTVFGLPPSFLLLLLLLPLLLLLVLLLLMLRALSGLPLRGVCNLKGGGGGASFPLLPGR